MTEFKEYDITANGILQHVTECGSGPAVLLCHGFPEIGFSWRHQLKALANAGYRAIAPDMRGYGKTEAPSDVGSYTVLHMVGDMVGLLQTLEIQKATIIGHDWGAPVAWTAAQLRPDIFNGVVGLCVPYSPRGPLSSLDAMRRAGHNRFYQLYFQEPGVAERDFELDAGQTIRRMMWTLSGGPSVQWDGTIGPQGALYALSQPETEMQWITEAELAVYSVAFQACGFRGGLNWYRNIDRNWELASALNGLSIRQPAWFITGAKDPVYPLVRPLIDALPKTVPGLMGVSVLPDVGHWVHQESPEAVNDLLLYFLGRISQ